jgi:predicted ATPase
LGRLSILGRDAQILPFDDGSIHEVDYEDTSSAQIVRHFVNERERFLEELLKEPPSLFPDPE